MKLKVCVVYDSKADGYLAPFIARKTEEAIRMFNSTCKDENSNFNKFPNDFTLFEIAEYEDEKAQYLPYETKINLCMASDFVKKD